MPLLSIEEIQQKLTDSRFSLIKYEGFYTFFGVEPYYRLKYEQVREDSQLSVRDIYIYEHDSYVCVDITSPRYGIISGVAQISYIINFVQEFGVDFYVNIRDEHYPIADINTSGYKKPFCIEYSISDPVPDGFVYAHLYATRCSSEPYEMTFIFEENYDVSITDIESTDDIYDFVSGDGSYDEYFELFEGIVADNDGSISKMDFLYRVYVVLGSESMMKRAI